MNALSSESNNVFVEFGTNIKRNSGHDKERVKVQGRKLTITCRCADRLESHSSYISQSSTTQTCSDIAPHVLLPETHSNIKKLTKLHYTWR